MKYLKVTITIMVITLFSTNLFAQDQFVRGAVIEAPEMYASGFGATVAGVDLDGDGKLEIYSVSGMSDFMTGDEIPQIIKYELNGTSWDSVWAASLPNELQNSWAALTVGDLDGDGKQELIWGFTNNFGVNTTPSRIVVFEANGDDILGIDDGAGNYLPNAQWDFDLEPSTNVRPLKWYAVDIDGDGSQEVVFAGRQNTITLGIISVTDIPDAGDGSETWSFKMTNQTELYNRFARTAVIDGPDGGFGGVVTGMDYDGDGLMDLYTVNDNWSDGPNGELIPTLYKYELVSGAWVMRWSTQLPGIDFQNTWPILLAGDWDGDGKGEVIWCPINNFGVGNEDPDRIVVYETPGDGSDVMGIDNGDGKYAPNAGWNMDVPPSTNMRPFRAVVTDIDGDGELEFVFTERTNYYVWGVVGVDDIPDAGDGSETWTMKASGTPDAGNDYRDIAVIDETIYLFGSGGDVRVITNDGTNFTVNAAHQAYPGWSWLSANTVDIDGDGNMEIVTGDYLSGGSGSVWVLTPDADTLAGFKVADFSANAASQITSVKVGDINGDGLTDFVVGFRGTDAIYRVAYNGGDITDEANYTTSLLDQGVLGVEGIGQFDYLALSDVDGDGSDEIFYTGIPRGVDGNTQPLTVGSYSDTVKVDGGSRWDLTIANSAIHLFDGSGNLQRIDYANDQWNIYPSQPGIVNGAFLTASAADLDGDGYEEIMVGNWYDAKVNMLKWINGAWVATEVADFTDEGANRLNGGSLGDIDNDGNWDFVTGSREAVPNGQILRVKHTGGDITDPANWQGEVIDQGYDDKYTQYEVTLIANLDDDPEMEVLYTSDYARGPNVDADPTFPIIILDIIKVETTPIAEVKIDADGDFIPDNSGNTYTIQGVVTSPDYQGTRLEIYVQDATAGIQVTAANDSGMVYEVGDLVQITGTIGQFRGITQIEVADPKADIYPLGKGNLPVPKVLSVEEWLENAEMYEGSLIRFNGLTKVAGDWPGGVSSGNFIFSNGITEFTYRVDSDTDIDENAEPVYPISSIGISGQFTFSDPANDGYQLLPRFYSDITQNVKVPPNPNFALLSPPDGATVSIADSSDAWDISWRQAVDLNGDAVIYLWTTVDGGLVSPPLSDTTYSLTAETVLGAMGGADSVTVQWTVKAKGAEQDIISSIDTFSVTFVNLIVGVEGQNIPNKFFVDQNYPNPFNPTTTIRFGLPSESMVDLRIYDVLGREVRTIVSNQALKAGTYNFIFDASNIASGTYIYRLTTDNNVVTKKMLLLK